MSDRFFNDIELPDLPSEISLQTPENGFIQIFGRIGKLALTNSQGIESILISQADADATYVGLNNNQTVNGAKTFTAPTTISVNSSLPSLHITQTGAGDVLLVEDSTNPDTTPFRITNNGSIVSENPASFGSVSSNEFIGPLTGNASTASALQTPRTITLAGDVTGSTTFDGSANVTIITVSSGGAGAPTLIEANKIYKIAKNTQTLFTEEIDLEDGAEIDFEENSVLVEVN